MNFKSTYQYLIYVLLLLLSACSDAENETRLVDLFAIASLDIIEISFPANANEDVVSVDSFFDYTIEGLKSNGVDTVPVMRNIVWSVSDGVQSSIDQNGRLSAGPVAELVTITAEVGGLSDTFEVRVSAAKFDQVVMLNSTQVLVNMCQARRITPIGNYISDDDSPDEQRPVDSNVINTIEWLIRNAEDDSSSQRALIKTQNNLVDLQAFESGEVIIQARAPSISQGGVVVTSADFNQTLENNLNTLKICLSSETDLSACSLTAQELTENNVMSLISVGNYQQSDGSNLSVNISELSKWGIDNNTNASIALSDDRQQLNVTGRQRNSTANVSVACGNIEQVILDSDIENGVVLSVPVTCENGSLNCLQATQEINVVEEIVDAITVTANGSSLVDNTAFIFTTRPSTIVLEVTAVLSDGSSRIVTEDVNFINSSTDVITEIPDSPGEYTVQSRGNDVEVLIVFGTKNFTAKITLPN